MFPARCSRLPCMNIAVTMVRYQITWWGGVPETPSWPWQAMSPDDVTPHSIPGVGELVGDRPVLHHPLVAPLAQADPAVLEPEVHERAEHDDRDREHRETARRYVVLQREQSRPPPQRSPSGGPLEGLLGVIARAHQRARGHDSNPIA